jgi:protein gp37
MKNSSISWTHHTMNPWVGCTRVSSGCLNCYADALNHRWGKDLWGPGRERQRTSAAYWKQPLAWNREAEKSGERRRVFCASMADVFDSAAPEEWRKKAGPAVKRRIAEAIGIPVEQLDNPWTSRRL